MKKILILGAGQSAPYLIDYLLKESIANNWFVTVGDLDEEQARSAIGTHPNGNAIRFDVNDSAMRKQQIEQADVVVNFLSPVFQYIVAHDCIHCKTHMVSASYANKKVIDMAADAQRNGVLILNEMGLDPGIDHMSAMKLIHYVQENGGQISSFVSYGAGLPAPEVADNPLRYCITWNARNVARAGEVGALYMEDGKRKLLSHHNVFNRTWPVEVEGLGTFEAIANRNSLIYRNLFGLPNVHTIIRGTLRYPGWSETWNQVIKLGFPNDNMPIPNAAEMSYRELTQMFLPIHLSGSNLERRVANYLNINPTGKIMQNLKWLGLFSDEIIGGKVSTAADILTQLLVKKLPLPPNGRDMVILIHEVYADYPGDKPRREHIKTTLIDYGQPGGFTAISKTVGLPAAIATKLILTGKLPLTGCHIPTLPTIYLPVLEELKLHNVAFEEEVRELPLEDS
ncbi:MAG: saccharopine dehydrogenase C-terminal domain-containing protein [Calditrichia bacterium]